LASDWKGGYFRMAREFDRHRLRALQREAGLTGKELAEKVGCSSVTISRIRSGRQRPREELVTAIAAALGVDESQLYGTAEAAAQAGGNPLSRDEREMLEAYRQMGPTERAKAWGFVVGLAHSGKDGMALAAAHMAAAARQEMRGKKQ
jgi:transcriptional regulator with XRE-family HTH domain